ncbi:sigma-70 family RNA polymerase sigma factor [Streptomyces sp. DSM 44915]|uniref:Sigma-70 family RNA polymerase sigma factor n=1 Tax=Streptomyces chisholmiae TaxID=3075540 RepID=A0ABU2JT00_9ACTN|nr:sigma-70 family RNA polymerase sigma factor [Streptomyces sp. DSM 44915]MDT0268120.1 sigma-70 family RNA polymerase sigma factor [Streptomyces sp. DSM 44915]
MRESEFGVWYEALWPQVFRTVAISVGDRGLAEEAVAEAFAKALARWPRPAQADNPPAWLHRVAVNEVRSRWRRARLERRMVRRLAGRADASAAVLPTARDDALWAAVAQLPERMRQMVALRYVLDLPEAEVARQLGVSRGTVASTLSTARGRLATALAETHHPAASVAAREEAR